MRTTLAIDDDVLAAAQHLARRQHKTLGELISALARKGLRAETSDTGATVLAVRNGIPLLPVQPGSGVATLELVNQLRDESD